MQNDNLWAPWRWSYIRGLGDEDPGPGREESQKNNPGSGCFLCEAATVEVGSEQFKQRLVLLRDDRGLIMLNRYPYTNGHLLITPLEHLGGLTDFTSTQRIGLMELTALGQQLLQDALDPQGFNIGINIGRCAGAGLPGHLHVHIVPRWHGDTNFMQVVGQIRVIPQALEDSYDRLSQMIKKIAGPDPDGPD